jgi:hypothetical protein
MTAGTAQKISNAALSCAAGVASFLFSLSALIYLTQVDQKIVAALVAGAFCLLVSYVAAERPNSESARALAALSERLLAVEDGDLVSPAPPSVQRTMPKLAAALHSLGQRFFRVDAPLVVRGELRIENAMLSPALGLGMVHGDVSRTHQRLDAGPMFGGQGDADRSSDVDAVRAELEWLRNGQHDPARHALDFRNRVNLREEDRELISCEPGKQRTSFRIRNVLGIDHDTKPVRDHYQELVSASMSETVVDELEAIEVDEQHG